MELAFSLKDAGAPEFEVPYAYDQRRLKPTSKNKFENGFIDIQLKATNHLKDRLTAIEIKVNNTEKGFRGVLSDLLKICALKNGGWKFRCVTAVLVYGNSGSRNTKFRKIKEALIKDAGAKVLPIGDPGFEIIVLGWEENATKNMTRDAYHQWVAKITRKRDE